MAIHTTLFEARCKHCKFAESFTPTKQDGKKSKLKRTYCTNPKSGRYAYMISQRDKACKEVKPYWES